MVLSFSQCIIDRGVGPRVYSAGAALKAAKHSLEDDTPRVNPESGFK